jgi:hypothetical protein
LLPQIGQVVFENRSERLCDMFPTALDSTGSLIKLTKGRRSVHSFSETRSRKKAS